MQHPFERFLAISQIEHRRTDVAPPETHGFCERFHRTVKEEFFPVAFRKTRTWIAIWSSTTERAHPGYRPQGRTPYQTILDGVNPISKDVAADQSPMSKEVEEKVNQLPKQVVA